MNIAHLLRKYELDEWGGTETSLRNICRGLLMDGVDSTIFCPVSSKKHEFTGASTDPLQELGCKIIRYHSLIPVWNLSEQQKKDYRKVGGNLLSFDLPWLLWKEKDISLIHSHTLNRLGAIGYHLAKLRKIPFVLTIHGGYYGIPNAIQENFQREIKNGIEWGKVIGFFLGSRYLLDRADAIITLNKREGELLKERFPNKSILIQHHGIDYDCFQNDCTSIAMTVFPEVRDRTILLTVGRIDPQKNQLWLVKEMPQVLKVCPNALLLLVGSSTNENYEREVRSEIVKSGLQNKVLLLNNLPFLDKSLIGLYQLAKVFILPSILEEFGLVILEAWAAGTQVISSSTVGAKDLIINNKNGWLFDLSNSQDFHNKLAIALSGTYSKSVIEEGKKLTRTKYNIQVEVDKLNTLYHELCAGKRI